MKGAGKTTKKIVGRMTIIALDLLVASSSVSCRIKVHNIIPEANASIAANTADPICLFMPLHTQQQVFHFGVHPGWT